MARLPFATLEAFSAIARTGSFRAAAETLGVQPSTVSHQLKALEDRLGTALFVRTTRSVSLTDAGRALHRATLPAFEQIEAGLQSARDIGRSRHGRLRITAPGFAFDMMIAPRLTAFRAAYPDVAIEINIDEAFVDLREAGIHAGIRLGDRIDPDMIAVKIRGPTALAVLASEDYLAHAGVPRHPGDLPDHECIGYRFRSSGQLASWSFIKDDTDFTVDLPHRLVVDSVDAMLTLVRSGAGLGYTFADYARGHAKAESLKVLLSDCIRPLPNTYIYFPREYRQFELLRLFVSYLRTAP